MSYADLTTGFPTPDEGLFEAFFRLSPGLILVIGDDRRVVAVNDAGVRLLGARDAGELVGRDYLTLLHEDDRAIALERARRLLDGGDTEPLRLLRLLSGQDARAVEVEITSAALDIGGRRFVLSCGRDVTERRELEERIKAQSERLDRADRLAGVGELAAVIAHEVMQPLAAALTYLQGIERLLATPDLRPATLERPVSEAHRQVDRAVETIRGIRRLLDVSPPRMEAVDLAGVVAEVAEELRAGMRRSGISFAFDAVEGVSTLTADRTQMLQLVRNLLRNAKQALRRSASGDRVIDCRIEGDGDRLRLIVADNGPGIDPALGDSLWQPLAKTTGSGLGLGLPICRRIVENHGGTIEAHDRAAGACFVVTLPRNRGDGG